MSEPKIAGMIQQLDAWQLLSEDEASQAQSPLPSAADPKLFLKYELEMQIAALRKSSIAQEPALVAELNELQVKKAALKTQRRSVAQAFSMQQDRTKAQLRASEEAVKGLADQLATMESRHSSRPRELQESETFNSLKVALKPLEDATRAIEAEKRRLQALSNQQENSLFPLSETLQMLCEDARSRGAEIEQAQSQREYLSKKLADMRKGHEAESDRFLEEYKAKEALTEVLKRKNELTSRVAAIQQRLAEVSLQEEQTQEQLNSVTPRTPLFADIGKMERMLSEKCREAIKCTFNQLLGDISRDHSYNIELSILKEQVTQMNQQEFRLLDQWKGQRDQDQTTLDALQAGSQQHVALRTQMHMRRQQQASYTAMIGTWKKQVQTALDEARNAPAPLADDVFRTEFQKRLVRLLPEDDKEDTSMLFDKYLEALHSPQVLEGRSSRLRQTNTEQATLTELCQSLQFSKASLESEKSDLQKELFAIGAQEKSLRAVCDQAGGKSPAAFKKTLAEGYSKEEYSLLLKTFGKQAIEKMTKGTTVAPPRSGLHSKFDEVFKALQGCELRTDSHKKACEALGKLRKDTDELYRAYWDSHQLTQSQIEAVTEAEEELINRTESITETKLREIRVSVGRNRYMKDTKMTDLTNQVYKCHEKASECRIKLSEIDKKHENEVKSLEKATGEVKARRAALKEKLAQIRSAKLQLAALEKQLHDMDTGEEAQPLRRTHSCTELDMDYAANSANEQPREKHVAKTYIFTEAEPGLPDIKLDLTSGFQFDQVRPSNLGDFTLIEADFFRAIQPLLDGGLFYKKFSQKSSLVSAEFDPLEAEVLPPEKCGYGLRELKLNRALTKLEVRQPHKPGIESSVMLDKLLDPIVPQHTLAILKTQKSAWLSGQQPPEDEELKRKYPEFKRMGIMDFQSPIFEAKCMDCIHYVFFLALERGGRVELVADSYVLFKRWVEGVRALVRCRKLLPKLKFKLV